MANKRSISIVIPNYNGAKLLPMYLPSTIAAIQNAGVPYEIIVVDDCSKDGSVQLIKANYPGLTLLVNDHNRGFSYSCNRGIKVAQYELIFLLNSDVKLSPDYFAAQWSYFDQEDTFGVMGRIIDMEGEHIQDAARMPGFNGLKLKTSYFYYTTAPDPSLYTLYLSGANALVDAAKIKAIGGFDELFSPFYSEDLEMSLRAWRLGWKCYYEHHSICRHQISASTKNYETAAWIKGVYYRNRFFVHAIHLEGLSRLLWFMQISLVDLLPKMLAGQWWMWKSYTGLIRHRQQIALSRQKLHQLMKDHDRQLSLFDVIKTIRKSVTNKVLIRFKP
jgi:GT2 family glycosyltransferase